MANRFEELKKVLTKSNSNETITSEETGACSIPPTPPPMPPIINISIETSDGLEIQCPFVDFSEISFEEELGRGSFGVAYKALWRDNYVTVKKFDQNSKTHEFETQIKKLSRVNHPHIIAFYGISSIKKSNYLIMEYAEGGSLDEFLHGHFQAYYTMSHALSWARQCAEAVAYMHAIKPKPLLHRNLTPLNILLTDKGRTLKISGFGTVNDIVTVLSNHKGSARWMAPEVFVSSKYTQKCDVFSWAIVLWEMLAREIPFNDIVNSYSVLWKIHKGERPPPIRDLPEAITQLMTSCWANEPESRPSMQYVVEKMTMLTQEFPGADEPLDYDFFNQKINFDYESTDDSDSTY